MKKYLLLLPLLLGANLANAQEGAGIVLGINLHPESFYSACPYPLTSGWYYGYTDLATYSIQTVPGAYLGFSMGSILPYVSMDMLYVKESFTDYDEHWATWDSLTCRKRSVDETKYSSSATVIVPHLGLRFYVMQAKPKAYLNFSFFKAIPFVSGEEKQYKAYYDSLGVIDTVVTDTTIALDKDKKDAIKGALGLWGIKMSLGGEYFFSDAFSVSGECGMKFYFPGWKYKHTEEDPPPWPDKDIDDDKLSAMYISTYTGLTLNYYFGGEKK